MVRTELQVKVFQGSDRPTRVRVNHKVLAKGQGLRQLVNTVAGRDGEGETLGAELSQPDDMMPGLEVGLVVEVGPRDIRRLKYMDLHKQRSK